MNSLPVEVHFTANSDMKNLLNLTNGIFGVLGINVSVVKLPLQGELIVYIVS